MNLFNLADELVLAIFNEVQSQYGTRVTVPKRYVHKILFRLREDFPEDRVLFESAPFYWYNYGPFSELIAKSIDNLLEAEIIGIESEFYILTRPIEELELVADYEEDIHSLVNDYSVYDNERLVKDVYYKSAPFDFIPIYKKEILDPIDRHFSEINTQNFDHYFSPDQIIDKCYECESKLPFEPIFRGFNEQFSILSMILDNLYEEFVFDYFPITFDAIKLFWYTFAKALRVVTHEDFDLYNRSETRWTNSYFEKLTESRNKLKNLKELESSKIVTKDIEVSESAQKVLLSTVGRYISD